MQEPTKGRGSASGHSGIATPGLPRRAVAIATDDLIAASDDEHSSRRAQDRCIAGVVREPVQLEVGVELRERCFQRQASAGRPDTGRVVRHDCGRTAHFRLSNHSGRKDAAPSANRYHAAQLVLSI